MISKKLDKGMTTVKQGQTSIMFVATLLMRTITKEYVYTFKRDQYEPSPNYLDPIRVELEIRYPICYTVCNKIRVLYLYLYMEC